MGSQLTRDNPSIQPSQIVVLLELVPRFIERAEHCRAYHALFCACILGYL